MSKPFDTPEDPRYPRQHTMVSISAKKSEPVVITDNYPGLIPKTTAYLPLSKWKFIEGDIASTLNERLKEKGCPRGSFGRGQNRVERMLAREMMALVWAVEPAWVDEPMMRLAIKNWRALMPSEKWWLIQQVEQFKQTAADQGGWGWREAIAVALCEKGVKQLELWSAA